MTVTVEVPLLTPCDDKPIDAVCVVQDDGRYSDRVKLILDGKTYLLNALDLKAAIEKAVVR